MFPMKEHEKKPKMGLVIAVGEKGSHDEPSKGASDSGGPGLDEEEAPTTEEEGETSPDDESSEDDESMLDKAEVHGAEALIQAVHSGDPHAVTSAFKAMYTACHLRGEKDKEPGTGY